jgi:hypothetical protein
LVAACSIAARSRRPVTHSQHKLWLADPTPATGATIVPVSPAMVISEVLSVRARRERNPERGGSTLRTLITFVIIGFALFATFKIAPPYMNNYQLQDFMTTEARFALVNKKSEEDIRADMMKKIAELEIPATEKDLKIINAPTSTQISLQYSVPVDLKVYQFSLDFSPVADSHAI